MTKELAALAARNNAEWCDAVCRASGKGGEFHDALWLNRHGTPRFYPDAVTVAGEEVAANILEAVSTTIAMHPGRGWAIKDSFACIDFARVGFSPLFDAQWIHCDPRKEHNPLSSRIARDEAELWAWSQAWNAGGSPADIPFKPVLLHEPGIRFVQVERSGTIIGGGVLSKSESVVGLSNVFAAGVDMDTVWKALIGCSGREFPGSPLVGYGRGEELKAACRNGFRTIGPLRIWLRLE